MFDLPPPCHIPTLPVRDLCADLGITRQTLYHFVSPTGELRDDRKRLLQHRTVGRAE